MDKLDVQNFIEKAGDRNVFIFTDEDIMYNTKGEHSSVVFDYTNEIVHVIRTNVEVSTQSTGCPFELITFEFARIVFMRILLTKEEALVELEKMKVLMTQEAYDRAYDFITTSQYAINSNYPTPAGGNYVKPSGPAIMDANTGNTIYDPNQGNS